MGAKKKPTEDEKKRRRVETLLEALSRPITTHAALALVRDLYGCGHAPAQRYLRRAKRVLAARQRKLVVDPRAEAVERALQLGADACAAADYGARVAAERLLMDLQGTKAPEQVEIGPNEQLAEALKAATAVAKQAAKARPIDLPEGDSGVEDP